MTFSNIIVVFELLISQFATTQFLEYSISIYVIFFGVTVCLCNVWRKENVSKTDTIYITLFNLIPVLNSTTLIY